uniref:Uncharacterized protein n=1 Tax=Tanacetum cinerariifolium TaxID=118510 RepID=A0A6L2M3W5_TANCI|nr:hypothetical protein [Tanacetum cinerariifolium]
MLAPSGEGLIIYQAYGNLYAMTVARDGVASLKRRRRDQSSDGVRKMATTSGRGRLKEDLESSMWRQRLDYKATPSRIYKKKSGWRRKIPDAFTSPSLDEDSDAVASKVFLRRLPFDAITRILTPSLECFDRVAKD